MSAGEWFATLSMVVWVIIICWAIVNADRRAERENWEIIDEVDKKREEE